MYFILVIQFLTAMAINEQLVLVIIMKKVLYDFPQSTFCPLNPQNSLT